MLLPILLVATFLPLPQASLRCAAGASANAVARTQPLYGPHGVIAVLKVSSDDDHGKNTHLCSADYVLLIRSDGATRAVDLLTTDADWDRTLYLRLDGFAHNGKRVFGVLAELGKYPSTMAFAYSIAEGNAKLIDLKRQFAHVVTAGCSATFDVVGTTETGAIVVELKSSELCEAKGRWLINPAGTSAHRLPPGAAVEPLFTSGADVEPRI